jgi:2,4-diaminopentanoate dehydrogenase
VKQRIRTVLFGLGAIGIGIGRVATQRDDIEIVGAIDSAPDKAGHPLSDILGGSTNGHGEPIISGNTEKVLSEARPQAVLHATGSYLPDVAPQLIACCRAGANVVSTCEELSFPWVRQPELAKQIDAASKASGATVLGTGVNPGFVMDTFAAVASGVCARVESVRLARIVDVSKRREQLQRKVGVGLTADEFGARAATGRFGHVGLKESCWLLAEALGWRLESLEETIEPVGAGAGIRQVAVGVLGGRIVIEAVVQMSTDVDRQRDEIVIEGSPPVRLTIEGGIMGDVATAAIVVNAVPRVVAHPPGLITMLDLPVVAGRGVA